MSGFHTPPLSRDEIVRILVESQIASVSEADFVNPTPNFVDNIFTKLLNHLGLLQDDHGQVNFVALEKFENPDMHYDAVRLINMSSKVMELMVAIGCPLKFSLNDLVRPEPNRLLKFLAAVLNFSLHKDSRVAIIEPYFDQLSLLEKQLQDRKEKISELNEEIAQCNEEREKEIPLVEEAEAKVKELRQTIQNLNNHQASLRGNLKKIKEQVMELEEKISSAEIDLVQSVHENVSLQSKIVQSPEKLQRVLEEKKEAQTEAKNRERLAIQTYEEKSAKLEIYTKALKKMSKQLTHMRSIQEQVNSAKSIDRDVKLLKAKLSEQAMMDMSLEAKIVELHGKLEQLEQHKRESEKERDFRHEENTRELEKVKLEIVSRKQNLEGRNRRIEAILAEVDATTSKINSCKESGVTKQQELLEKCEEIVNEFHQYSHSVTTALPNINEVAQ